MEIKLIDWNVNRRADLTAHRALLDDTGWHVCTLQEVTPDALTSLLEGADVDGSHALDHVKQVGRVVDGAMVLVRQPFQLRGAAVVASTPSPDRTLLARVGREGGRDFGMSVLSAALPPAASWGALKVEQCLRIVDVLARRTAPILVGIDANTPRSDAADLEQVEYWWPEEARLLGPEPGHALQDAYRRWRTDQGTGEPMPVSFEGKGPGRRYDHLLASPEFAVGSVEYRFDEQVRALSDHAMVSATLEL